MGNLPTVAIVGRPNVGKSALFNRLVRRRIAIVHDEPGVTRDRLVAECRAGSVPFTLIDTGGIGTGVGDALDERVRAEAFLAMEMADLIVLVGDGREGLMPVDEIVAKELRSTRRPVIVAVNKIDHARQSSQDSEFSKLGFDPVIPISAAHGRGIAELVEAIEEQLPRPAAIDPPVVRPLRLTIVGRPNVGKSSLINAILKDSRTMVSHLRGTTRDAVDIPYERNGKPFVLIDTAGIRAPGKQNSSVEIFSVMRSERSIESADVCALVVDAVDGITGQDKKIAGLIQRNHKPCIIAINKLDLVKPRTGLREFLNALLDRIRSDLFFLSYAPIDILSAQTGENLDRLFTSIEKIEKHSQRTIRTGPLNRLLQGALESHPPPLQGSKRLKLLYATQLNQRAGGISPPTFLLFVNQGDLLTAEYRRYLEAKIREEARYYGLPIILKVRERRDPG